MKDILEAHDRIHIALEAGNLQEAAALACAALEKGLVSPLLLNLRAWWHERRGDETAAEVDLELAHQLFPDDPTICNALGLHRMRQRRWYDAVSLFQSVSSSQPDFLPGLQHLAACLEAIGQLSSAVKVHSQILARDPDNFQSLLSMAAIELRSGQIQTGKQYATKAALVRPEEPATRCVIAEIELAQGHNLYPLSTLSTVCTDGSVATPLRALAHGIMGDALHGEKKYDDAFANYSSAAKLLREHYSPFYNDFRKEGMIAFVERLIKQTEEIGAGKNVHQITNQPNSKFRHIFIAGFPRSGTTLLESALGLKKEASISSEAEGFSAPLRRFYASGQHIRQLLEANLDTLVGFQTAYWTELESKYVDVKSPIFIDKHPFNTIRLPLIARIFPSAKTILIVRDPRDVIISCFRRRFTMNAAIYDFTDLERTAILYDRCMHFSSVCMLNFGVNVMTIKYEELAKQFDLSIAAIARFLDLPLDVTARQIKQDASDRRIATPSGLQLAQGLSSQHVGQWKHYEKHLQPVMKTLRPWIQKYGY